MTFTQEMKFDTSYRRGAALGFSSFNISTYLFAYIETRVSKTRAKHIYVEEGFEGNGPRIPDACVDAIEIDNFKSTCARNTPTPALGSIANEHDCPSIMISGIHVPKSHNGTKIYIRDGELLKGDERLIQRHSPQLKKKKVPASISPLPIVKKEAARTDTTRFMTFFQYLPARLAYSC